MNNEVTEQLSNKLHTIFFKLGAYNSDPQLHANNVIDNNSKLAKECLILLKIKVKSSKEFLGY